MKTRKRRSGGGGGGNRGSNGRKGERNIISNEIRQFMELTAAIKLYHWHTRQYAEHKSTDDLFGKMNDLVDKYVETLLGKSPTIRFTGFRSLALPDFTNRSAFMSGIEKYANAIKNRKYSDADSDLENMRDELVGHLNQFIYLMSFQ